MPTQGAGKKRKRVDARDDIAVAKLNKTAGPQVMFTGAADASPSGLAASQRELPAVAASPAATSKDPITRAIFASSIARTKGMRVWISGDVVGKIAAIGFVGQPWP